MTKIDIMNIAVIERVITKLSFWGIAIDLHLIWPPQIEKHCDQ